MAALGGLRIGGAWPLRHREHQLLDMALEVEWRIVFSLESIYILNGMPRASIAATLTVRIAVVAAEYK